MAEKGPKYYRCSPNPVDCTGKQADPRNGCPKCEFTIQWKQFRAKVEAEFKKGSPGPEADRDWPIDHIHDQVQRVVNHDVRYARRHNPKWDAVTARLVDIYRSEVGMKRATDAFNRSEEVKAKNDEARRNKGRGD